MDKPIMSIEEFLDKFPPEKRRESILTCHKKEIYMLKKKGYTIAQIVTFFELVVGQKVSRSSVIRVISKKTKSDPKRDPSANHEPTIQEPKTAPDCDKQQTGKETPPESSKDIPRLTKKQTRENRAASFDT